jgi:hypothetical protein
MILVVRLSQIIGQREGASGRHLISWPYVSRGRSSSRKTTKHTGDMFADGARPRSRRARSSQYAFWRDLAILGAVASRPRRSPEGWTKLCSNPPAHDLFVSQDIEPRARTENDVRSREGVLSRCLRRGRDRLSAVVRRWAFRCAYSSHHSGNNPLAADPLGVWFVAPFTDCWCVDVPVSEIRDRLIEGHQGARRMR